MKLRTTVISAIAIGLLASSTVGVVAQDEEASTAPSTFTAELGFPDFSTDPTTGLTLAVGPLEATDPRASGTWMELDGGANLEDGQRFYRVINSSLRVVNDGGTWVGTMRGLQTRALPDGNDKAGSFYEFVGEGGYDGLSMFMFVSDRSKNGKLRGIIVPSDIVPNPPPPVAGADE